MIRKNTICLWYDKDALEAAQFYARTFPDSAVGRVLRAPGDYPSGTQGDVLTVEFTVAGVACLGLNGGTAFKHNEAFSFQIATDDRGNRPPVARHRWQRRPGKRLRLVQGQMGPVVADHAARPDRGNRRSGPGGGQACVRGDDDDGQDRHRGDRGGAARLTRRTRRPAIGAASARLPASGSSRSPVRFTNSS